MPKQKKLAPLSALQHEMQNSTRNLYNQTPTLTPQPITASQIAQIVAQSQAAKKRRAKPESIIPRQNGKLLFLEERHNEAIEQIHWTSKADRQDVIRTAVEDFLARHFDGQRLDPDGERLIKEYYDKTHVVR